METTLSAKRRGEAAEAAFLDRATHLGLNLAKPWGDSAPFDFIVIGETGLHRVQVKSVRTCHRRHASYHVGVGRGQHQKHAYTPQEIDFLAVLVVPLEAWYIIPVAALAGRKTLRLGSEHKQSRRLFEPYREAWSLLT
ncbi:MAG TPA: group I intron-associated PD-(D/E)XK endonuclease [Terriglobales bacterium]|nr:group I intron-associated PD-(D/E)XK endonuclease [Terriglobales bacterium]